MAADRALDIVFFVIAGLVAVPLLPWLVGSPSPTLAVLGAAGVLVFAAALAALVVLVVGPDWLAAVPARLGALAVRVMPKRGRRVEDKVRRAGREARLGMLHLLRERRTWLAVAFGFTALTWILEYGVLWVLLRGFGHDVPYLAVFVVGALLTILSTAVVIPGGSGVIEVTSLALFAGLVGGAGAASPALVLTWRATTFYYDIIVGGAIAFTFVTPGELEHVVEEARETHAMGDAERSDDDAAPPPG